MGSANESLNLAVQPPAVVLMAGLQGAGKTTSAAKLAKFLMEKEKKSVMLVSVDVYRPAAIKQLQTLSEEVGAHFFPSTVMEKPVAIAEKAINATLAPVETLFVVDAMTGQDAANTAQAFNEALPLTGVVLSKTDGDARGGAALSVRHITG